MGTKLAKCFVQGEPRIHPPPTWFNYCCPCVTRVLLPQWRSNLGRGLACPAPPPPAVNHSSEKVGQGFSPCSQWMVQLTPEGMWMDPHGFVRCASCPCLIIMFIKWRKKTVLHWQDNEKRDTQLVQGKTNGKKQHRKEKNVLTEKPGRLIWMQHNTFRAAASKVGTATKIFSLSLIWEKKKKIKRLLLVPHVCVLDLKPVCSWKPALNNLQLLISETLDSKLSCAMLIFLHVWRAMPFIYLV